MLYFLEFGINLIIYCGKNFGENDISILVQFEGKEIIVWNYLLLLLQLHYGEWFY